MNVVIATVVTVAILALVAAFIIGPVLDRRDLMGVVDALFGGSMALILALGLVLLWVSVTA